MTVAGTDALPAVPPRAVVARVLDWYADHARDLPWRRPGTTPWAVMVSEFMLQQTPVERVRTPWATWLERWPTPDALAAAPAGEAVRAWGRLGYPRRALRLHQAAVAITERFDGQVPADLEALRSLPGVGSYTAAAIASFAYGRRAVVLDTNVRRVISRVALGTAQPSNAPSRLEVAANSAETRTRARPAPGSVASSPAPRTTCAVAAPGAPPATRTASTQALPRAARAAARPGARRRRPFVSRKS